MLLLYPCLYAKLLYTKKKKKKNFQTKMRMEQLRNELFKWLQGDAETSVYCAQTSFTFAVRRFNVPLAPPAKRKSTPIRGACPKRSSALLSAIDVRRQQSKRKGQSHKWLKPCVKKLTVTLSQTWSSVCTVPATIQHPFVYVPRVSSNQLFMFCINDNVFLWTLYLMYS